MSEVEDHPERHRFELDVDGATAIATYRLHGDVITFVHTEVPKPLEGRGIASRLILGALAQVRARGLKVIPSCPFVKAYIGKHPEWQDLLV
jgi:predicted GNAT family acetyltransferase